MLKKIVSIAFLFFVFCSFAMAQSSPQDSPQVLKTKEETQKLSKEVATLFKDSKITEAVQKMRPYWPISDSEVTSFQEKTDDYMKMLLDPYGAIVGVEKIKQEKINDFALRETYVMRYQYSALRMIFTYYKSNQGWILNSFKWDEQFSELFEKE